MPKVGFFNARLIETLIGNSLSADLGQAFTLDRIAEAASRWDSSMSVNLFGQTRVDRRAFAVTSFAEAERADRAYWRSRTPDERLKALELCRQSACGCLCLLAVIPEGA